VILLGDNAGKSRFYIDNSVWRIDMAKQYFDMLEIKNRRFMYNPDTCTFILGRQYGKSNKIESSHAEEHFQSGTIEPYDHFIRGWIGTSNYYKHGIIHFAPPIDMKNDAMYIDGYNTLQMFRENGAAADTEVRGFGDVWEQSLSNILPGFTGQTKETEPKNMPMTELKQQLLLGELAKIGFTEAYYIPESDNIKIQPDNDRMPFIRGDDMIFYGTEYDSLVQETIRPLVSKVNDMIAGREKALAAEADSQSVYVYPAAYAREHGELPQYRASNRLNRECAQAIDEAVRENWNGSSLNPDCAQAVIEKYGVQRVNMVLANTLHQKEYDRRFSHDNTDWAGGFPRLEKGLDFYADAHPVKLDEFIKLAREAGEIRRGERPSAMEKLVSAAMIK